MRCPQFTIRAMLVLMLVVAAFFGGIKLERERQRRADEKTMSDQPQKWTMSVVRQPDGTLKQQIQPAGAAFPKQK